MIATDHQDPLRNWTDEERLHGSGPIVGDIATMKGLMMSKRIQITGLAVAALCALGALAATAQAADQWYTGNPTASTTLAVGSIKAIKGKSGVTTLKLPGFGINTVCSADSFSGKLTNVSTAGVIEAHVGISGWKFTGCVS